MIWPKTSMIWFDHDLIWHNFWPLDLIWDLIWSKFYQGDLIWDLIWHIFWGLDLIWDLIWQSFLNPWFDLRFDLSYFIGHLAAVYIWVFWLPLLLREEFWVLVADHVWCVWCSITQTQFGRVRMFRKNIFILHFFKSVNCYFYQFITLYIWAAMSWRDIP